MIFAKVIGTVVSEKSDQGVKKNKLLLVQQCNHKGILKQQFIVAVDLVGAGKGEIVIIAQGSSSRQTKSTYQKPIDAVIIGIVDIVSENNKEIYCK
jgi:carbon dioxide concentrating mechanism protein CcmL